MIKCLPKSRWAPNALKTLEHQPKRPQHIETHPNGAKPYINLIFNTAKNCASLLFAHRYLFTELVCALAGGPETMTAPSLATTQLQLRSQDYFKLLACVRR